MTDPFEKYEQEITDLKRQVKIVEARCGTQRATIRTLQKDAESQYHALSDQRAENLRLREACRQTNKGVHRLSRRCDSQRKRLMTMKAILGEAMAALRSRGVEPPEQWIEAIEGRRPVEKAT